MGSGYQFKKSTPSQAKPIEKKVDWGREISWRINRKPKQKNRFKTGIDCIDELLGGGLPYGNTIFYGEPGTGKSLLAREIAKQHKSVYICAEVVKDAPDPAVFENVQRADYTVYVPNSRTALKHIFAMKEKLEPELIVIDSLTSFFSVTKKALPESDIRELTGQLHQKADTEQIPIIGISELRGSGYNQTLAGGKGVAHACSLLVEFKHVFIDYESQSKRYGKELGQDVYTIRVDKDKDGVAPSKVREIRLTPEGYVIKEIKSMRGRDNG